MKNFLTFLLTLTGLCGATSCGEKAFKSIGVNDFASLIKDAEVQLVDVRTPEEFQEGHIDGAKLINVKADDFLALATQALDKEKAVAVYCRSGRRSANAAKLLAKEGFRVTNLLGGIKAWQSEGQPVVTDTEVPYTEAKNYFVNNTVKEVPSKITTKENFEKYFGMAAFMGKNGEPTAIDFDKQFVIAVVAPETDKATTLTAKSLKSTDGQLVFSCLQEVGEQQSFTIRPLLLIVVDKQYDAEVEVDVETLEK